MNERDEFMQETQHTFQISLSIVEINKNACFDKGRQIGLNHCSVYKVPLIPLEIKKERLMDLFVFFHRAWKENIKNWL